MTRKSKILIWDIETTPVKAYTWTLWPKSLSHDNIIEDWSIICAAWKLLGESKVHTTAVSKIGDDKKVCIALRNVLLDVDVIVHHNGDKFDLKKLNARLFKHGLDPLPKIPTVDTLKAARRVMALTSNRLDYISKLLFGKGKISVGFNLWVAVMAGDKKALKQMVTYNVEDVIILEQVYLYMRPFIINHPNLADKMECPTCGEDALKMNGTKKRATGTVAQMYQCTSCGAHSTGTKTLSKPDVKK
jgi:DNA polymerase elongation subunit (family B)